MKWIRVALVCASVGSPASAQLPEIKAGLMSRTDTVRIVAVNALYRVANQGHPFDSRAARSRMADLVRGQDSIDVILIGLLEKENGRTDRAAERHDEEYSDYHANLIGVVAALQDVRAIHALAGAINTGAMARDGLVALGEPAVPAVLSATRVEEYPIRHGAFLTLTKMLNVGSIGERSRGDVRRTLLDGLRDSSDFIRLESVNGLRHFHDSEVHSMMVRTAASDTGKRELAGKVVYPVREAAAKWLREHEERK